MQLAQKKKNSKWVLWRQTDTLTQTHMYTTMYDVEIEDVFLGVFSVLYVYFVLG